MSKDLIAKYCLREMTPSKTEFHSEKVLLQVFTKHSLTVMFTWTVIVIVLILLTVC